GGVPLADPTLIASLQKRQIAHPAIWVGNDLIYADIPARKFPPPDRTDASAVEYHLDQTDYLVAARSTSVGNGTLAYAVLVPLAALRSTLLTSVTTVAGLGLLLVVGTLIAVGFVTNRLLLPIRQLREGAALIGKGNLAQRITVKTGDEIEALADQFNDMASQLQESYSELENKVHMRTRELARSVEELRALGEVSHAVNSTLDLQAVLTTIVSKAVPLAGTEAGAIYVFNETSQEFQLRATYGMDDELIAAIHGHHIRMGETAVGQAAQRRAPVQIADVCDESASDVLAPIVRAGFRALLIVPLFSAERLVGALVVRRKQPGE